MRRLALGLIVAVYTLSCFAPRAHADITTNTADGEVSAMARSHTTTKRPSPSKPKAKPSQRTGKVGRNAHVASSDAVLRARIKKYEAAVAVYEEELANRNLCLQGAHIEGCGYPVEPQFGDTALPFVTGTVVGEPQGSPRVVLTPRQVAYIAVARLKLKAPTPGIGPPPSLNRWKMAAVGYPLWLWGEGQTNPAPVSDSVGGLYVSLDAHVSKIVFDMGDGTKVTCRGAGKKWGRWVSPGEKSPSCGHVYTRPSLPKANYTVTATTYWSVAWNVTGQTGVIPFVQSAQTTLPVGELQVLVR